MAVRTSNWGEAENGPRPTPDPRIGSLVAAMDVTVQLPIACRPEAFWALVTAVERMGEFSPECVAAWWVDDGLGRSVGGRFEGRNRVEDGDDAFEWIRPCDVVAYEPPRLFAYTVGDRFDGTPATRWAFRVDTTETGCLVEQRFEHLPEGLSGLRLQAEQVDDPGALVAERRAMLRDGMHQTLERMRAVLEA